MYDIPRLQQPGAAHGLLVPGGRAEAVDHAVRQAARRASAVLLPTLALLLGFIFRAAIAFAA